MIKLIKTRTLSYSIVIGITIGLGLLSKYAALYFLIFLVLWWLIYDRGKNLKIKNLILITFFAFIVSSGNLYWNYENDFVTINHTISNADLKSIIFNYKNIFEFLSSQLLVFGPVLLILYIFIVFESFYINKNLSLLAILSFPIIFLITIQSFLKIANANWAITAYIAATILLSIFVVTYKRIYLRFIFKIGLLVNIAISAFILIITVTGSFYPIELKSNPLRKNLGFELLAEQIVNVFQNQTLSSIIFESRSDITRFNYYLNRFENKFKGKIFLISDNKVHGNFYEAHYKFNPQLFKMGDKVLLVSQNKIEQNNNSLSNFNLLKKISTKTVDKITRSYYLYSATIVKK